jgi:demethylmenaquinone methyltransferase/2-methoxy-6-polyprenyl-1,4-benzoquinol methylase
MVERKTDFGFDRISFKEKTERVKHLFTEVASRYDVMNDVMSLGLHRCWKKTFVHRLPLRPDLHILDVAGGTGDKSYPHLQLKVTVCDLTFSMLEEGRHKAINQGLLKNLEWCCGNAEHLPIPDQSVDIYTVAFGMRNVTDKEQALKEAWRVLKPDGWFFCLEFSQGNKPILSKVYDMYSFQFLPRFGRWVAGNEPAYQYLVESIRQFPSQQQWQTAIEQADFQNVAFENFSQGVVALHSARK